MIRKYPLLLSAFVFLSAHAHAEDRSGLAYTARSSSVQKQSEELRTLTYARPDATPVENPQVKAQGVAAQQQEKKMETPSDAAWEKYKALATGQAKPETPDPALKAATAPAPQKTEEEVPIGLAGILKEYQKTKAARSEMRTLVITKPEAPAAPVKPEVAPPATTPAE